MSEEKDAVAFDDAFESAPVAETPPAAESITSPEPSPDPAPSDAPPVAETPPVEAAPSAEKPEHTVPLPVLLRTRDELGTKLSAAEQRALAAERQLAAFLRKQEEAKATVDVPHPLDDPDGFKASLLTLQQRAVQEAVGPLREQHQQQLEQLSKTMLVRHIGAEKFGELEQFINAAPDQAHAIAMRQADPYGWFFEKFEQAKAAREAESALKLIKEKPLEARIAEAVAAERAKWEAEHGGGQPQPAQPAQPTTPERPRNPDGTFASPSPQRHRPEPLAAVIGAVAPTGGEARSAFDQAIPS